MKKEKKGAGGRRNRQKSELKARSGRASVTSASPSRLPSDRPRCLRRRRRPRGGGAFEGRAAARPEGRRRRAVGRIPLVGALVKARRKGNVEKENEDSVRVMVKAQREGRKEGGREK